MIGAFARSFINLNIRLSHWFDGFLPQAYRIDGNRDFLDNVLPSLIADGLVVYDIGGGKHPCISLEEKRERNIRLVGLDIDSSQLSAAPVGTYDKEVCADVSSYRGGGEADLAVCCTLLEHVADVPGAINAIASVLKPGGRAALFFPSRNAAFARLNLILPEGIKRKLLYAVFPGSRKGQGFRSYYSRCTERELLSLAEAANLKLEQIRRYWFSGYFTFLFPLHFSWRVLQIIGRAILGDRLAETVVVILYKPRSSPAPDLRH